MVCSAVRPFFRAQYTMVTGRRTWQPNFERPLFSSDSFIQVALEFFCFDQSSNHSAMADDALNAHRMNLGSGGKQILPRDGWYIRHGEKVWQKMVDREGRALGIKRVLEERGLWPEEGLPRLCKGDGCRDSNPRCCAVRVLEAQPDFQDQKSLLQEITEEEGMIFEMYPKFHCECNWIERVWAEMKRITREEYDYSFASLKERVPLLPQRIPIQHWSITNSVRGN